MEDEEKDSEMKEEYKEDSYEDDSSIKEKKSYHSNEFFDAISDVENFTAYDKERSVIKKEIEKYFTTENEMSFSGI